LCDGFINDALTEMTCNWLGLDDFWLLNAVTVGKRNYPLPGGFQPTGNSWPCLYFIQKSKSQILLGPDPPYAPFPLSMRYWRSPQELVQDGDIPEVPNEYRKYLSYYAVAQMASGDESSILRKDMFEQWSEGKREFNEWIQGGSTNNPTVRNVIEGASPLYFR